MHQYLGAGLLHELHPARGGCGFLQQGGDLVQDPALIHVALERGYRPVIDNHLHIGGHIGSIENAKRCQCCDSVRKHK